VIDVAFTALFLGAMALSRRPAAAPEDALAKA
jgi:hypothetical protein